MRSRLPFVSLAVCGFALLVVGVVPSSAGRAAPSLDIDRSEPEKDATGPRTEGDLPTDRPIVATVVEVDQDAGRVTLDTAHGQVALSVDQDLAERLSPGDVVVLRLTERDSDFPSALPREEPAAPESPNRI